MSLLGRDYTELEFTHDDITRTVYQRSSGPPVILMHELPGLAEPTVRLAEELVGAGYTVLLPHLFGKILSQPHNHTIASIESDAVSLANLAFLCVQREFAFLHGSKSAPIANWLRALAKKVSDERNGTRVGAIGMCLTGGYVPQI
jgi:dienelactone hydrolase